MATSTQQRNTTIDASHYTWYKQIAASNPLITMADLHRMAHNILQDNYILLTREQRQLQDANVYISNSELVGLLLRLAIYKKVDLVRMLTTVDEGDHCSNAG